MRMLLGLWVGGLLLGACETGKLNPDQVGVLEADTGGLSGDGGGAGGEGAAGDGSAGDDGASGDVVEHCGPIDGDESWGPPGSIHRIRCTVTVRAGSLVIEPGVAVVVAQGEGLVVGDEGGPAGLVVEGTAEQPVLVSGEGESSGSWSGLRVLTGASAALHHLHLEDGGTTNRGALHVDGPTIAVDGLRITGAPSCGLRLQGGGALAEGAGGLELTGNGLPACAWIDAVESLPGAAAGNDYTGNLEDHIRVWRGELERAVSWTDPGVPLRLEDTVELAGSAESPATLSVDAGMVLAFANGKGITVGGAGRAAGLQLRGTEEAPVVLRGADSALPGSWGQVSLESGTLPDQTRLDHVVMEQGGSRGLAMLEVDDTTLHFDALTLRDCAGDALGLHPGAHIGEEGARLAISGCGAPLFVSADGVGELAGLELALGDFETAPQIRIRARTDADAAVMRSATWSNLGAPYRVERTVKLHGDASLTLDAGVDLRFVTSAGIEAGTGSGTGGFAVEGTAEAPVHLGAADAELPGAWGGVRLGAGLDPALTDIAHLELAYAGRGRRAALWVDGADLSVRDTLIRDVDPEACGVYWSGTEPQLESVVFDNTPGGELCVP